MKETSRREAFAGIAAAGAALARGQHPRQPVLDVQALVGDVGPVRSVDGGRAGHLLQLRMEELLGRVPNEGEEGARVVKTTSQKQSSQKTDLNSFKI